MPEDSGQERREISIRSRLFGLRLVAWKKRCRALLRRNLGPSFELALRDRLVAAPFFGQDFNFVLRVPFHELGWDTNSLRTAWEVDHELPLIFALDDNFVGDDSASRRIGNRHPLDDGVIKERIVTLLWPGNDWTIRDGGE